MKIRGILEKKYKKKILHLSSSEAASYSLSQKDKATIVLALSFLDPNS
jgi:hypothetical protein